MKTKLSLLSILISLLGCQPSINKNAEGLIIEKLAKEKYFELRDCFEIYQNDISEKLSLEVQAHLLNTFNKNKASNEVIVELFIKYESELNDSVKAEIKLVEADNYLKLFNYQKALDANQSILENYIDALDSSKIADIENMNNIFGPLVDVPAQQVLISGDNYIPIKRDVAGLMNVEVEIKNNSYNFIYDTGAGMPVIKRSFAEKLKLEMHETSIDVKSATDKIVKSSLAVIDTLKIDNILVLNSVFLVIEDVMLEFPQINFFPLAAIGFPIMEEFKEFTITKTDTLIVPQKPTSGNLANMRLNGLSPNVNLYTGTDTLEFAFDTGATNTHYTSKFFKKYRNELEQKAKMDSVRTSSAGGSILNQSYLVDSCYLFIGKEKAVLNDLHVHTKLNNTFEDVYGNLGQDLIRQFNRMTLNFEDMYLKFE